MCKEKKIKLTGTGSNLKEAGSTGEAELLKLSVGDADVCDVFFHVTEHTVF